ncbi:MAG: hypothetical protein KF784_06995 [Fimbriimonadaceae bacterium]|nr:hypothetical protein [Fimbriimonadaceae bacterium]
MADGISATDINPYYYVPNKAKPKSELDMETFLRLLTVQLANQNPLEPMGDRDFFAQMAQLGTVQGMDKLNDSMEVAQASGMIGKVVTAFRPMTETGDGFNTIVEGLVNKVFTRNGDYYLQLMQANGGLVDVRVNQVQSVANF